MTDTDEMRINFERAVHRVHGAAVFRIHEEHRRVELGEDRDFILAAYRAERTRREAAETVGYDLLESVRDLIHLILYPEDGSMPAAIEALSHFCDEAEAAWQEASKE